MLQWPSHDRAIPSYGDLDLGDRGARHTLSLPRGSLHADPADPALAQPHSTRFRTTAYPAPRLAVPFPLRPLERPHLEED